MIDEVWSITTVEDSVYWISEDTYEQLKHSLSKVNAAPLDACDFITFNVLSGAEVVVRVGAISHLHYNNQEIRDRHKEYNKEWDRQNVDYDD